MIIKFDNFITENYENQNIDANLSEAITSWQEGINLYGQKKDYQPLVSILEQLIDCTQLLINSKSSGYKNSEAIQEMCKQVWTTLEPELQKYQQEDQIGEGYQKLKSLI